MIAAIYCRVSTDAQDNEGTSLETQVEACTKKAADLKLEVPKNHVFVEIYSGLTIDRPKLQRLRDLIRNRGIEKLIIYTLDRISRDPVHSIILQEEMERAGVEIVSVTESIDSSDLGKLISYIRGYAAKLETEKIKERTTRGRRARALSGKLPASSHARLFGYNYIPGRGVGEGVRYVNENKAKWVKEMYRWLVEEGLSINKITCRLRDLNVPTPSGGGYWIRSTVHKILSNRAYTGKTYAFTQTYGLPKYRMKKNTKREKSGRIWNPRQDWIEIPGATPPIIDEELFEAAQAQLNINKERARGNTKRQYLLSGHIFCSTCRRGYWAKCSVTKRGQKRYERRYYHCPGNLRIVSPEACGNRRLNARSIEELVWSKVESVLAEPEFIISELNKREAGDKQASFLEKELQEVETALLQLEKRNEKLLNAWLWEQDEELVRAQKQKLDKQRRSLELKHSALRRQIDSSKSKEVDSANVLDAIKRISKNLGNLNFENKRLALEALQIKVSVTGSQLEITGSIPVSPRVSTLSTLSGWRRPGPRPGS